MSQIKRLKMTLRYWMTCHTDDSTRHADHAICFTPDSPLLLSLLLTKALRRCMSPPIRTEKGKYCDVLCWVSGKLWDEVMPFHLDYWTRFTSDICKTI